MNATSDCIELTLPFKAEYVSVARLTVSGIASRLRFDIETIEDIKVAVAEVCNKLVHIGSKQVECYSIHFVLKEGSLKINFKCQDETLKCIFHDEDELGLSIINALMDDVEICLENGNILSLSKTVEGNS